MKCFSMRTHFFILFLFIFNIWSINSYSHNNEILKQYQEIEELSLSGKQALNNQERKNLFQEALEHPVTALSVENIKKYDPDQTIGFCFGRAMAVHLLARAHYGLASSSIRKLFVIGDLRSGASPEWRFHVTTVVKGLTSRNRKTWYAIDPILETPILLSTWMKTIQSKWDQNQKAMFYWVNNSVILPDTSHFIDLKNIEKETGERILELSFNPDKKEGFQKLMFHGMNLYQLTPDAESKYFYTVNFESIPLYPFDFLSIRVNDLMISYNNYFKDLLNSIYLSVPDGGIVYADSVL